ncbi:MAG: UDP-N-acetylglucosamine 2-epimerase (non-hydrolyzing) [Lautropia sp.]|nr:UDP-N-acetylglucosamine 2-epimerase (non-hydrolyzing) [Lautropia sp.]
MSKQRIFSVVGARPQFVKAAIVNQALEKHAGIDHQIVHTGQHYDHDMSDIFFKELGIPQPAFNLNISASGHGAMTGRMLEGLEDLYLAEKPSVAVVYGDTNSTLAGALAAAKIHLPLAHVEAGLRSFNRMPEEINRVLTDHVTDVHFSVTDVSTANLLREGISGPNVLQVGDVMYDCALQMAEVAERSSRALETFGVSPGRFVLCTVHRANNTDDPRRLKCLMEGLDLLSTHLPVILPLHPRTRARVESLGFKARSSSFEIVEPIGYIDMVRLERTAALVVTDSGGVQREAFFHKVPCVTFRDETEWTELVDSGWNTLAALDDPEHFKDVCLSRVGVRGDAKEHYGNGDAGIKIAKVLAEMPGMVFKR